MSKSFSQIKKELENDWIAESIKGRVEYHLTKYRKSHDNRGRVSILIDKQEIHKASDLETEISNYNLWEHSGNAILVALNNGYLHTDSFYNSYYEYSNNSIEDNINSSNALIRLFAIFDKRIGKRRFKELEGTLIGNALWVKPFYVFRYHCEYK